ncbi:TetR/AcrR family transcriptional regulator [Ferruginibacter sp.]
MASKDRIQKLKDDTRCNILTASLDIVKEEGWPALSMRKIADKIDYTAPIIYEYFSNKDAILQELTRMGYVKLAKQMEEAKSRFTDPAQQLEAMWLAYWNFAFADKELYKVMYGVEVNCCALQNTCDDLNAPSNMLWDKIQELVPADKKNDEQFIDTKYYTFWSVVHGLISINLTRQITSEDLNRQVLKDAISGIINSIKN